MANDVKDTLINVISKIANKAVAEGNYDRTILAKILYCSDATQGQYKIQYQNGHYIAYSPDTQVKYSNGAMVYVTVPQNDFTKRLFIKGLATNDNNQRTYLTNLEGDQQFVTFGQNWIERENSDELYLSSYMGLPESGKGEGIKNFYRADEQNISENCLSLMTVGMIENLIRGGDGYFRLGASFKTRLRDDRKSEGNYGIRVVLSFENKDPNTGEINTSYQTYQLDTFNMMGSPFNFTEYSPRYAYWEVDKEHFKRVESITGFVEGFPNTDNIPAKDTDEYKDILIKDINLYSALKSYDAVVDNSRVLEIKAINGTSFTFPDPYGKAIEKLEFESVFTINGIEVDASDLEIYWAKKNGAINSVGNTKYLDYFGRGWQCLNEGSIIALDDLNPSEEDLKEYSYTGEDGKKCKIKWTSVKNIFLNKTDCKGRETVLKCCVRYENKTYYSRELPIYNPAGMYLVLKSSEGTKFYNGKGYTDITAGLFRTTINQQGHFNDVPQWVGFENDTYGSSPEWIDINATENRNISYKWELINNNTVSEIPPANKKEWLVSEPDWKTKDDSISNYQDTPSFNDEEVESYLEALSVKTGIDTVLLMNCYERYIYYINYSNNPPSNAGDTEIERARKRYQKIEQDWQKYLDSKFGNTSYINTMAFDLLGPSTVVGEWNAKDIMKTTETESLEQGLLKMYRQQRDPVPYAMINSTTLQPESDSNNLPFPDYKRNTLFRLKIARIKNIMRVRVTALITEQKGSVTVTEPIETKEISIVNEIGGSLKYDLQIDNGNQNFVYSVGGAKPEISLKPLTFKLYDDSGALLYDSAKDDDDEGQRTRIEYLNPQWKFNITKTMLVTQYSEDLPNCTVDPDIPNRLVVTREPIFYYDIADNYDVNLKERGNIELSVTIVDDTGLTQGVYTASTNFTFTKQGELGTNGTNMALVIKDNKYEQYRSDVLSREEFSRFTYNNGKNEDIIETFYPDERHLKSTYLYATEIWDHNGESSWNLVDSFEKGSFCNLKFAQSGTENEDHEIELGGSNIAILNGYWTEDGEISVVDDQSKWSALFDAPKSVRSQTQAGKANIYNRPSFQFQGSSVGDTITLMLSPPAGITEYDEKYYKPMDVIYEQNSTPYNWNAFNVVQCEAQHAIKEQINPVTNEPIIRKNFGYYKIPFFYYAHYSKDNALESTYSNVTKQGCDPARHFVITGGFDEVIYGADGGNPQYNKQNPFMFRLFDEDGNDITTEALNSKETVINDITYGYAGGLNSTLKIEWKCSEAFQSLPIVTQNLIVPYSNYANDQELLNKYCTYNGKTYHCIKSHTPSQRVEVKSASGEKTIYNPNGSEHEFVTPYWEQVSPQIGNNMRSFTPPPTFDSVEADVFFSSWISVKVTYIRNYIVPKNKHRKEQSASTYDKYEAAALIPVNMICNIYGSEEINNWDGKRVQVEDGYIISPKVAAGYKDEYNAFTGITIGTKMITNGEKGEEMETGLFGYGQYENSKLGAGRIGYGQTLFMDAKTGLAAFGPRGSTQIILNPKIASVGKESWSRIAGWYFSNNYLYKPLWADDEFDSEYSYIDVTTKKMVSNFDYTKDLYDTNPPDADGVKIPGSVGMYVPASSSAKLTADTVFLWASAQDITSSSFDDNGGLSALQQIVKNINRLFTKEDFPYIYQVGSKSEEITLHVKYGYFINRYYEFFDAYSSLIPEIGDLGYQYKQSYNNFINECRSDSTLRDYITRIETKNIALANFFSSLPSGKIITRVSDNEPMIPLIDDLLCCENILEIKKWYLNGNNPVINSYNTTLYNTLKTRIKDYSDAWEDFANVINAETQKEFVIAYKQLVNIIRDNIDFLLHENQDKRAYKNVDFTNTTQPIIPIVNADKVTIDNYSQIKATYIGPSPTATEKQINYYKDSDKGLLQYFATYDSLHGKYDKWKDNIGGGQAVSYNTSDIDKKRHANFSVTYGGEMTCNKANIRGKITAISGEIGENTKNKLRIGYYKDNSYYLLYNKVFQVKAMTAAGQDIWLEDPSIMIDGTIKARSGQIGKTNNVAGNDNHTLFIEYDWWARRLPDNNTSWREKTSEGGRYKTPQFDTEQPAKPTYALWHPYFSIIDNPNGAINRGQDGQWDFAYKAGDACFLGRMYATGGRIGDWVVDTENYVFRDPFYNIILRAGRGTGSDNSYIKCGNTVFYGDGHIDGACAKGMTWSDNMRQIEDLPYEPAWSISADGEAHFTNNKSEFAAKTIYLGGGATAGGATFSGSSCILPNNAEINFGDKSLSLDESGKFNFSSGAIIDGEVKITGDAQFDGDLSLKSSSKLQIGDTTVSDNGVSIGNSIWLRSQTAHLPALTDIGSHIHISSNGDINGVGHLSADNFIISEGENSYVYYNGTEHTLWGFVEMIVRALMPASTDTGGDDDPHTHGITLRQV